MISFETHITIGADPAQIWPVLIDTARYPDWDSGVIGVEGTVALGNRIKITSEVSPDRAFPAKVTTLDDPHEMVWTGGMPLGLFRGVRTFTLEEVPAGTQFTMREEFRGPLLRLIARTLPDLQPSFDRFAAGLKVEVERAASPNTETDSKQGA